MCLCVCEDGGRAREERGGKEGEEGRRKGEGEREEKGGGRKVGGRWEEEVEKGGREEEGKEHGHIAKLTCTCKPYTHITYTITHPTHPPHTFTMYTHTHTHTHTTNYIPAGLCCGSHTAAAGT